MQILLKLLFFYIYKNYFYFILILLYFLSNFIFAEILKRKTSIYYPSKLSKNYLLNICKIIENFSFLFLLNQIILNYLKFKLKTKLITHL